MIQFEYQGGKSAFPSLKYKEWDDNTIEGEVKNVESGDFPPHGIHDMILTIDEWKVCLSHRREYAKVLKEDARGRSGYTERAYPGEWTIQVMEE